MKKKKIKKLLQIMLDNQDLFHFRDGLCFWCNMLFWNSKIKYEEFKILYHYIQCNKPKNITKNMILENFGCWWKRGDIKPRLRWINKHIKLKL